MTPVLVYPDVRAAVAWLEAAFGFAERVRIGDRHRAQLRIGVDGAVVIADVGGALRVLEDIGGHRWELTQTVRDVNPVEWGETTVAPW